MAQHLKKIKPKVAAYRPVAAAQPVVPYPRAILSASPCSLSYAAIVGAHLKKVKPLLAFQAWQGEMCLGA
jgi:hypothetical protein